MKNKTEKLTELKRKLRKAEGCLKRCHSKEKKAEWEQRIDALQSYIYAFEK